MLKNILNNKTNPRDEFNEAIEAIGDILVFHTKLKHNNEVIPGLNDLKNLLVGLLGLRDSNPESFDKLMLDEEYWEVLKKNKEEAQLRLSYYPEKYLITFSRLIEQITRVIQASLESENKEITLQATSQLSLYLRSITDMGEADLLVRQVLRAMYQIAKKIISVNSQLAGPATYEWYSFVVFEEKKANEKILFGSYLKDLNKYLFAIMKDVIDDSQFDLFKEFIAHSIDGIHVPKFKLNDIHDIHDILRAEGFEKYRKLTEQNNTNSRIRELIDDAKTNYSFNDYEKWETKLDELKSDLYSNLTKSGKVKFTKLTNDIKVAALLVFANNSFVSLMFTIASWIVYSKKISLEEKALFIREIWTHKNPSDSNASYGGNDIYPDSLQKTVFYYFTNESDSLTFFWDDHHSSTSYKNKYFLYLLLWHLRKILPATQIGADSNQLSDEKSNIESYPEIEDFSLPFELATELSSVKYKADKLLEIDVPLLKNDELLELLIPNKDKEIDFKLTPLLKRISGNAQKKIKDKESNQLLSSQKIDDFKSSVAEAYNKSVLFRKLFENYGMLDDRVSDGEVIESSLIGFNRLEDRAIFFENWHIGYSNWGKSYGTAMAEGENNRIFESIVKNLKRTKNRNLIDSLNQHSINDSTVIFASHEMMYDYFEGHESYIPYWKEITDKEKELYFAGWFDFNGTRIKVFNHYLENKNYYFAVFNMDSLGKLIQNYPLLTNDLPEHPEYLYEHFRIMIGDFSTDNNLIKRFLDNPPEWLLKKGDREEQKRYLKSHLLLQIGEKFDLNFSKNLRGIICYS